MKEKSIDLFNCLTESEKKQGKLRGMISAAIENKRRELGLTQKEFAKTLGISQAMVSKLESSENNISVDRLVDLFEKLDIKYSIQIEGKESMNSIFTNCEDI